MQHQKAKKPQSKEGGKDAYTEAAEKGFQAVLIAESFTANFKPLSHEKPKCLFPIANIPMLLFQIELLAKNNVNKIICASARNTDTLKRQWQQVKASHMNGKQARIDVKFLKLQRPTSLCEAIREITEHCELQDDFILISGDIVSNADFSEALRQHYDSKKKITTFQTIITKIFARLPFSSPLRVQGQEIVVTLDSETKQVVDYGQYASASQTSFQVNKKHIDLKRKQR